MTNNQPKVAGASEPQNTTPEAVPNSSHEGFLQELWSDAKELIHHAVIFGLLLAILSAFSFLIPRLPISETNKLTLKSFDLVLIYIVILIYTLLFLFKIIARIIDKNPGLRRVGTWLLSFRRSAEASGPTNSDEPDSSSSRKVVLNRISDLLILLAFALTVFFAVRGAEWVYSFSIPLAASIKGILILVYLPNEITFFALFSLLSIVTGLVILATSLHSKKAFVFSWWLPAFGLLGFGIGTALSTSRLSSIYTPMEKAKRRPEE